MAKRIAIAGKGGTGKSTLAALMILTLKQLNEGPILAIDADADANLGPLLGIEAKQTIGELREEVLAEIKNFPPGMSKANYVQAGLDQIIEENQGFDLITMGKGEGPGCYCYLNSLIRKFSDDLLPSYSWVVIDNEAGLEHISRRTSTHLDFLIVTVDENPNSWRTAKKIAEISRYLKNDVKEMMLITNMVREENLDRVRQQIADLNLNYLGDIPFNAKLRDMVFEGKSLVNFKHQIIQDKIQGIISTIGGQNATT